MSGCFSPIWFWKSLKEKLLVKSLFCFALFFKLKSGSHSFCSIQPQTLVDGYPVGYSNNNLVESSTLSRIKTVVQALQSPGWLQYTDCWTQPPFLISRSELRSESLHFWEVPEWCWLGWWRATSWEVIQRCGYAFHHISAAKSHQ